MPSRRPGTLYTGSADSLMIRVGQHKTKAFDGFTAKYGVDQLIWFEVHGTRESAFRRERQIKKWKRRWKVQMIEERNPDWRELYDEVRLGDVKDASDWVPACAGMSGEEK